MAGYRYRNRKTRTSWLIALRPMLFYVELRIEVDERWGKTYITWEVELSPHVLIIVTHEISWRGIRERKVIATLAIEWISVTSTSEDFAKAMISILREVFEHGTIIFRKTEEG